MDPVSTIFSLDDRKLSGEQLDSDRVPVHNKVTCGVQSEVNKGETIDYARVKVVRANGDRTSPRDASDLEPHIERLTHHVHGEIELDGMI